MSGGVMSGDGRPNQDDSGYVPAPKPDLHERIAAAVAAKRQTAWYWDGGGDPAWAARRLILAACDHADSVLARRREGVARGCVHCQAGHEVRDLALMWLGPGWEET